MKRRFQFLLILGCFSFRSDHDMMRHIINGTTVLWSKGHSSEVPSVSYFCIASWYSFCIAGSRFNFLSICSNLTLA